jgi:hypothetical protein
MKMVEKADVFFLSKRDGNHVLLSEHEYNYTGAVYFHNTIDSLEESNRRGKHKHSKGKT